MRNNFEHLDERLDQWWKRSARHNYADLNIGSSNMISGTDEIDMFRQFDPTPADLIFWGETFNLNAIVAEVERIMPKLSAEARKPHWQADS